MTSLSDIIHSSPEEIVQLIRDENPIFTNLMTTSENLQKAIKSLDEYSDQLMIDCPYAKRYVENELIPENFQRIRWKGFAALRIKDYIKHEGKSFIDSNHDDALIKNQSIENIWEAVRNNKINNSVDFYIDWLYLIRQLNKKLANFIPKRSIIEDWMDRHPIGTDSKIVKHRAKNKKRIINVFIEHISSGQINNKKFKFSKDLSYDEKYALVSEWWNNHVFHLQFAIKEPEMLNQMLDYTLSEETMQSLRKAQKVGIPFFINPYYLSLVNINISDEFKNSDLAIRDYIFYSKELIDSFGSIKAWEKEDIVEAGKPNPAGWILPSDNNVHRRYPEVAILIPDTVGRACAGLCVSCQRMYDFQSGNLNFDLDKLKPKENWKEKLKRLLQYYRDDSQLRDILLTGGDALMSSNSSLKHMFNEIYAMAKLKIEDNKERIEGEKYAEIQRIRLGSRIPVYLPQRITDDLIDILTNFKKRAQKVGIKQFVIQTHFESSMEITPEAANGIKRLISAGWLITNQNVFTSASSLRGHTIKLRKSLNDIGIVTYYTFSVKGFMENKHNFATNSRIVQEQLQEKSFGNVPNNLLENIKNLSKEPSKLVDNISKIREDASIPFLATDRSVMNMPGIGKSLTYKTVGLTPEGNRILIFDHDATRKHSPIVDKMDDIRIVESKSISNYLRQIEEMGEDLEEYNSIFGFSLGQTEARHSVFEYRDYNFVPSRRMTNISIQ